MTPLKRSEGHWLAVLALLYSAAYWGIVWYPLRLLDTAGLDGLWQTLISYGAAVLVAAPLWRRLRCIASHWFSYSLLALAAGWASLAFILAMLEGTVVRVMLLFYLAPVWTLLLARVFLGERFTPRILRLMLMAMAGAVLMLWEPEALRASHLLADSLAISSGLAFAISNVLIRRLQHEPIIVKAQVTWIGCVLVAGAAILLRGDPVPTVSLMPVIWLMLLGIGGFALANIMLQYGVSHLPAQRSAVILLFELIVAGVSAALLAGETLNLQEILGGLLILLAGYLVAVMRERQHEPL